MSEAIFANAEIVLPDGVMRGAVTVLDGVIASIEEGDATPPGAVDFAGDTLIPGLVELHTDNVEKHMVPRPGIVWPAPVAAILGHDAQMAAAGVTTVYDAIAVGEYMDRNYRRELLKTVMDAVREAADSGLFKVDHRIHLRCEIADDIVTELFEPYADDPIVGLISVMDHTPGQRQWRDLKSFKTFKNANMSDAEFQTYIDKRINDQSGNREQNRRAILDRWANRGPVASHDDTTPEHVVEAVEDGICISEFPTTMEAAAAAKAAGMHTVMGAPNVVRGGSHSGNVSAIDLAEAGLLDALSSDYAPISLVHAAFALHERVGMSLPDATATITQNPAQMLNLTDRGQIAPGLRGDLVRVARHGEAAIVRGTWVQGERVA